ncbi:putative killer cell immunoglobulin-like receptor-like protein KIR3DX1 isoform X1 [Bos javanicus]|uniref:putative killer cell immunoglobulin-like receptor-like protein KIR3DX1 isoform X1 n=1 Tax=Bos javanicus TaxID=9906 RepID=UPI002AA6A9D6|nr:putative killer cell immunoglobulin-like receptor-like protein KIR3DX1 isoform X1 [Bos javanicus]
MCPTLLSLLSLGKYEKLSLSAWPSPVVPLGQTVTLQCHSHSPLKRFRLFKTDGKRRLSELQGHHFNNFTLGPVTGEHAGSYTCSGAYRSAPSDPLQIVVSGVFTKPSISAHPGPLVQQGENVTLCCHSLVMFDKFILHHENSTGHFQRRGEMLTGGYAPADFSIGPMTLASAGTYRCYGSLRRSPYEWSAPSDPVDIIITGSTTSTCPSIMDPHTTEEARLPQGHSSKLHLLLRLSVAFIYTCIFLAVLVCHWLPIKCCHHGRRAQRRQNSEW